MSKVIQLHVNDDVAIALGDIQKGENIRMQAINNQMIEINVLEDIPKGHKVSVRPVMEGEDVTKFGYSIGKAKENISEGAWVHTHNLKSGLKGILDYTYQPGREYHAESESKHTFQGYLRENGEAGIRNDIWIINTVGCINKTCEVLAKMGNETFKDRKFDGIHHFPHPYGCSQLGDDLSHTQKLLAALVQHPNAAGVLVVGLGCENNQIDAFKKVIGDYPPNRIKFLKAQDVDNELDIGLGLIEELVEYAEQFERQPISVSKLKIGLKCGGSDGFSGITANPLVGALSDLVVEEGGTTILTEVPEMFGAETILMNRANDEETFHKIVHLINNFKEYFIRHGQEVYENPSPGNKDGGISTLEEKSLGCTQKGGHANVVDVRPYGERAVKPGLNLVNAPGNDLVSVTALAAAGANIVLFTTGRGTPFGGPVPTVKIATNSDLADRKKHWIDYNAGQLLEGKDIAELKHDFFRYILDLASGEKKTNNERFGFREISIFKEGVIL
ncbi:D-altronate dehydratase [Scopulibacillus darangshiensis]|uniref:D-altronate dehydratase n=1 Tax=Scopulibacillus darangshiensis TaxID=442528 RepID=A0A4R2NIE2_9BACL|nr:altronate dehydratase family protein [Scopulibacillus darangshiensis]TCP21279.1 D-altronate dehydratase [Scopulibacillus darangshiensis]